MKFSILVTPGVNAVTQVRRAEQAGFDAAFFVDSPMIFGDPYVAMAACAASTKSITLATGVTNPISRSLPATAATFSSLNALAPGRMILGIGVGFTATLAMGDRQATVQELGDFVHGFRQLLAGETVNSRVGEREVRAKFLN